MHRDESKVTAWSFWRYSLNLTICGDSVFRHACCDEVLGFCRISNPCDKTHWYLHTHGAKLYLTCSLQRLKTSITKTRLISSVVKTNADAGLVLRGYQPLSNKDSLFLSSVRLHLISPPQRCAWKTGFFYVCPILCQSLCELSCITAAPCLVSSRLSIWYYKCTCCVFFDFAGRRLIWFLWK